MKKLLEILKEINPDVAFEGRTDLFQSGDLDSMNIITLISKLNDAFDIEITVTEIVPENFNSAEGMMNMIKRLQMEDA